MPRTEAQKRWAEANREKISENRKQWVAKNGCWWRKYRDDVAYSLWLTAKVRAKKKRVPFSIRKEDILVPEFCPVLGIKLVRNLGESGPADHSPSIDRILPELGYVPGNIVVISNRANRIKSNASVAELERVATWLRGVLNGNPQQN